MKHIHFLLSILLYLVCHVSGNTQGVIDRSSGVVYNEEVAIDLRLHTNGYAVGFQSGKIISFDRSKFWKIEFGEIKHSKEDKKSLDFVAFGGTNTDRNYIFGKQNSLYFLKVGFGSKKFLTEKAQRKGLAVGYSYNAGPMLGLLKPYYLELTRFTPGTNAPFASIEKFSEDNRDIFLDESKVRDFAGFGKGFDEIKVKPGLHLQGAVHLDWGAFDKFVKAVELGMYVDIFLKRVPIMVVENNDSVYINLYIGIQLGKRS